MRKKRLLSEVIFVLVIGLILTAPLVDHFFAIAPDIEIRENRALAGPPEIGDKFHLKRFRREFEDYFNDHFGFRKFLVYGYNWIQLHLFAKGEGVLIGKDDWLFLEKGVRSDLDSPIPVVFDLCGDAPFADSELDRWTQRLINNWRELEQRNIEYLYLPVPNKHTIYQEALPTYGHCGKQKTRLDQLMGRLQSFPNFPVLDLRSTYLAKKQAGKTLYLRNDTHWNDSGVYYAYESIVNHMAGRINIDKLNDRIGFVAGMGKGGDLANMLGLKQKDRNPEAKLAIQRKSVRQNLKPFQEQLPQNIKRRFDAWQHPNQHLSKVLLFHDSFGVGNFAVLLAESFSKSYFIQQSPIELDMEIIDLFKRDLVIHEMVERGLLLPKSR